MHLIQILQDRPKVFFGEQFPLTTLLMNLNGCKNYLNLPNLLRKNRNRINKQKGSELIEQVRARNDAVHVIDSLLLQYSLDTHEGILLMCLAEALMRIPDADTADALIKDKLSVADWKAHLSAK